MEIEQIVGDLGLAPDVKEDRPEFDLAHPFLLPRGAQARDTGRRIGHVGRAVDDEARAGAVRPGIARIAHVARRVAGQRALEALAVTLFEQHLPGLAVPVAPPAFVRPAQVKGKLDLGPVHQVVDRRLEDPAPVEPVEIGAERVDPGGASHRGLLAHDLGPRQVVEAERAGQLRLCVAGEVAGGCGRGGPFGETATPPRVIFGRAVELRQVESRDEGRRAAHRRVRGEFELRGLHDAPPAILGHVAECAFERVGRGAVDLTSLRLEVGLGQLQAADHVDQGRFEPVHRPCRKGEPLRVGRDLDPAQHVVGRHEVRAPPLGLPVVLAVRDPEAGGWIVKERLQQVGRADRRQKARDEMVAPCIAIDAVR
ncbi:hypothetical protein JSE7799_01242 [Jannaschia seosinensis]|uniref:Uncharacterized protein n=1 Tax=Jannaschia seosinensis TaxID=313367 RepID=A0A0M7B6Y1_9RHOB|nr:hypothetical protein JSE7799_01242 [Jannaschia seosinensis]